MWPGQCPFSALISSKCLPALFSWGGRSSRSQWMNGFQEKSRELIYSHSVSCSYLLSHITFKNIPVYVVLVKKTFCAVFLLNDFVIVFPIQFRKRGKHMRYTQNSETINILLFNHLLYRALLFFGKKCYPDSNKLNQEEFVGSPDLERI